MLREILEWVRTIVIACLIGLVLTLVLRPILVKGHSMEPTLGDNNYLLIEQLSYYWENPHLGDIIVFQSEMTDPDGEKRDLIKRVIGSEGDHITISDGRVYVNDVPLKEKYIKGSWTSGNMDLTVPQDAVFVLGDNRGNSMDSRSEAVGFVDENRIRGRVLIRILPLSRFGSID
jgi:signal peptidase I